MTSKELIVTPSKCTGCEACAQICTKNAISMVEDSEGFRYPSINDNVCIDCGLCKKVCPIEHMPDRFAEGKTAFGGYIKDADIREKSTSGGAFSAIAEAWCDTNYVIFGAETKGLEVYHSFILDKRELDRFRKSKYIQSHIGTAYKDAKLFLKEGRKVLFTGTPCQIAGLRSYLGKADTSRLLTVEVICEGVPTPHYIRRFDEHILKKYRSAIESIDYRYKDGMRWDYEVMQLSLKDNGKKLKKDRWFNPFWSIWLQHLMSRPSCYKCAFAVPARAADISLGDLWGVHIYCPELYGHNGGSSIVFCNTQKGREALEIAKPLMFGHDLDITMALRFQGPMHRNIPYNKKRDLFMKDVLSLDYDALVSKWAVKSSFKLLFQKYVLGNNAQKVWWFNFKNKLGIK